MTGFFKVSAPDRRWILRWVWIAAGLHFLAALLSRGYQAADEYFQILEFASYKLGYTPLERMPSELTFQMRPWLQPAIAWLIARAHLWIGWDDPFLWTFWMRLLSAGIGWLSGVVWLAGIWATPWSREAKRLATILTAVLWFLPALHARPSSEGWAGSFFLLGLSILLGSPRWGNPQRQWRWDILGGVCLGLAFESRFQMGLCIAGLAAWQLWQREWARAKVARIAAGLSALFLLGRAIDAWGYGAWVMSPWNYVQFNLIRGEVNRFGPSPWWDLLRMANTEAWPILGFGFLLIALVAWVRHWRSPWTWAFVPLFIVHNLIPHKELRFFFPIASAGAVWVLYSVLNRHGRVWRAPAALGSVLAGWNGVALIALTVTPAHRSVLMFEEIFKRVSEPEVAPVLLVSGDSPYYFLGSHTFFYRPRKLEVIDVGQTEQVGRVMQNTAREGKVVLLYHAELTLPPILRQDAAFARSCRLVYRNFPWGFERLVDWGDPLLHWKGRFNARTLYECNFNAEDSSRS